MELWTEYEGRTIDGLFPLTKLVRPEGRSAFFLTSNGNGVPRVIRLIEPHFDEDEILARWRGVAALNHPNILKLEKFGQVEFEDGSFLYAVMEPVDANLGEVLAEQRLSLPDTRQLASSLMSAIDTLHSHGFVHEHIEPAHVFAVGEVVKLRSDCIREAPEAEDGQRLKKQDIHAYSVVLLQALTRQKTLEAAAHDLPLPAPFDRIVRNGMNGQWGVPEISSALESDTMPRSTAPVPPAVPAASAPLPAAAPSPTAVPSPEPARLETRSTPEPTPFLEDDEPRSAGLSPKWIAAIGLAVVLLIWLGWRFFSDHPSSPATPPPTASVSSLAPKPAPATNTASAPAKPSAATTPAPVVRAAVTQPGLPADPQRQWRVIAYTYNRQDQAQHKTDTVARMHPDLQPQVFSPTGRAPYLVAIGGPMTRDEAFSLAQKVRNEGLPRDTYAQNYTGKGR